MGFTLTIYRSLHNYPAHSLLLVYTPTYSAYSQNHFPVITIIITTITYYYYYSYYYYCYSSSSSYYYCYIFYYPYTTIVISFTSTIIVIIIMIIVVSFVRSPRMVGSLSSSSHQVVLQLDWNKQEAPSFGQMDLGMNPGFDRSTPFVCRSQP